MRVNHNDRSGAKGVCVLGGGGGGGRGNLGMFFSIFYKIMVYLVYSLESPR